MAIYKLAGKIVDQFDDPTLAEQLMNEKTAAFSSVPLETDMDSDFALCINGKRQHRKFPVKTADLTKESITYYCYNRENLPEMFRGPAAYYLKHAAEHFGILLPDQVKDDAIESSRYVNIDGAINAADAITKEAAYQKIADHVHYEFPTMEPSDRSEAARLMSKLAAETGQSLPAYIKDYIPRERPGMLLKTALESRFHYLKLDRNFPAQEELKELFKVAHSSADAIKLLYAFDQSHGLDDYARFVDPWRAAYGGSLLKQARPMGDTSTGPSDSIEEQIQKRYRFESLTTTCRDKLNRIFNAETVDRISHDPEGFYDAAPANVKRILDRLLEETTQGVDREDYFLSEVKDSDN